jgi:hypothetical protein
MHDDDEILDAYEHEFDVEPPRRANRGFWLVAGTMLFACVFLLVEIFANRGIKDTIAHAQHSLREAQSLAETVRAETGTFEDAGAGGLAGRQSDLTYLGTDDGSSGLDELSVYASATGWAAAVQARPGACFYLRLTSEGEAFYGVGTICTARAALAAQESRW